MHLYSSEIISVFSLVLFIIIPAILLKFNNSYLLANQRIISLFKFHGFAFLHIFNTIIHLVHREFEVWFIFHFHNLIVNSHYVYFTIGEVHFDYLTGITLCLYLGLFLLFGFFTQFSRFHLFHLLNDDIDIANEIRITKLKRNNTMLKNCEIRIIIDATPKAFSFLLIKTRGLRFKYVKVIALTSSIFEIIDDSELEAILIHEYYHIKEHRSLIFNVIAIFNSMFFFIPKFRIIQQLISNNEELEADRFAIASISNPLSLARALYKIFIVPSKNLSLNKLGNSRLNFSGNNIFAQRLTQIIQYSDEKRNLNR